MSFETELTKQQPALKAYATKLCGNPYTADDLVQETYRKAWEAQDSFEPGTNMLAWLSTILYRYFCSAYRKRRREVPDPDGIMAAAISVEADQLLHLKVVEVLEAMRNLPEEQRAILVLAMDGCAYKDMAKRLGIALGTSKSRLNRARAHLARLTDGPYEP